MRIAGIVLVQGSNQPHSVNSFSHHSDVPLRSRNLALVDLLGDSLLNRVVTRLQKYRIEPLTVISDIDLAHTPELNWSVLNDFCKQDVKAVISRTFEDTLAVYRRYYDQSNPLPYLLIATWNDYEEGTAIERGLARCDKNQLDHQEAGGASR